MLFDFPTFSEQKASKAEQFETRCVKTIHNTLFPSVPWSSVRSLYGGDDVTWSGYTELVSNNGVPLPTMQFLRENLWDVELHDLLSKKISSYKFYKEWCKEEYEAISFLCIGTPVVCIPVDGSTMFEMVEDKQISFIAKPGYAILKLADYATLLKSRAVYTFNSSDYE